jgi:hypothetical protein
MTKKEKMYNNIRNHGNNLKFLFNVEMDSITLCKKLFRLEKGTLGQFGYHDVKKMSKQERRNSLKRATKEIKPLSVRRKLIAVSTLQKNVDPKMSKIFREDADWVKNTKEYKSQQAK